ncbi:hypothetical protein Anapl_00038 [Anas platyrhynchos]|uniref:Uncharacterized protein n=1 Tax=Anas platyrhynchos TaxID=8839 RepID=R0LDX3_ANAPL|nr:hypothetical protein Anapl_00038 [Anas platyrhynchos]
MVVLCSVGIRRYAKQQKNLEFEDKRKSPKRRRAPSKADQLGLRGAFPQLLRYDVKVSDVSKLVVQVVTFWSFWGVFGYQGNFLGPGHCSAGTTAALKGTVRAMRGTGTVPLT